MPTQSYRCYEDACAAADRLKAQHEELNDLITQLGDAFLNAGNAIHFHYVETDVPAEGDFIVSIPIDSAATLSRAIRNLIETYSRQKETPE